MSSSLGVNIISLAGHAAATAAVADRVAVDKAYCELAGIEVRSI